MGLKFWPAVQQLKPYKLSPFEQQVTDDFEKNVPMFGETFQPGQ